MPLVRAALAEPQVRAGSGLQHEREVLGAHRRRQVADHPVGADQRGPRRRRRSAPPGSVLIGRRVELGDTRQVAVAPKPAAIVLAERATAVARSFACTAALKLRAVPFSRTS